MAIVTGPQLNGNNRKPCAPTKDNPQAVFDSSVLLSKRIRKWQPPASQFGPGFHRQGLQGFADKVNVAVSSLLPLEAVPGMMSLIVGMFM